MASEASATWLTELIGTVAWPAVILAARYWFRGSIKSTIDTLSPRVSRVSVAGVSVELEAATLRERTPSWSAGGIDIRALAPIMLSDSSSQAFVRALSSPVEQEHAIIDLGDGKQWLASRLFIMSRLLEATSRLRAFVFLETANGQRRRFVGVAEPRSIHDALGKAYPWFEAAFAKAYANRFPAPERDVSELPFSQDWQTVAALNEFLQLIRLDQEPPEHERDEYTKLSGPTWEKTRWLDGGRLERRLGAALATSRYRTHKRRLTDEDGTRILEQEGDFVAVLDEDGQFRSLIDRRLLLEKHLQRA